MDANFLITSHPANRFEPQGDSGSCKYMVVENYIVYVHKDNIWQCLDRRFSDIAPLIDHVFSLPYRSLSGRVSRLN